MTINASKAQLPYKVVEAQEILKSLGFQKEQYSSRAGLVLLALSGLRPTDPWKKARRQSVTVSNDIMAFISKHYGIAYKPNTRETIRRRVLHQFVQAGVAHYNPDNPSLPVNSPKAHYALTQQALAVIRAYGTPAWENKAATFVKAKSKYAEIGLAKRAAKRVSVVFPDGQTFTLSPGKHNVVQAAVIEQFAPRFLKQPVTLYLGDTEKKNRYVSKELEQFTTSAIDWHGKMPDIVLLDKNRKWIFLVEVATSRGPVDKKRVLELRRLFSKSKRQLVFVSAFSDFTEFKKRIHEIEWETEVWIAAIPDHMIHYNGEKFLQPGRL